MSIETRELLERADQAVLLMTAAGVTPKWRNLIAELAEAFKTISEDNLFNSLRALRAEEELKELRAQLADDAWEPEDPEYHALRSGRAPVKHRIRAVFRDLLMVIASWAFIVAMTLSTTH